MERKRFGFPVRWVAALAVALILVTLPAGVVRAGSWVSGSTSTAYGSRSWKLYVPTGYTAGTAAPLVLMIHGCTQDADQFEAGTQMSTVAEQNGFLVVYPIQPSSVEQNKCWRWWYSAHQSRGSGEPAILKAVVDDIKASYTIDSDRVYVAGMSAGGAMTAIMAATYPDVFAAAGVHSGLEYKAASTSGDSLAAWNVMRTGGPNPKTQGKLAKEASGSAAQPVPTIVFHGTSDYTVYPVNGDQALSQAMWMNDYADDGVNNNSYDDTAEASVSGTVPGGYSYTQYIYKNSQGEPAGEKWVVTSLGHAWSGGSTNGSYTDPKGPKASTEMWRFFSQFPLTLPGSVVTADLKDGQYGGAISVSLTATNATDTIRYTTDGTDPTVTSPAYSGPISISTSTTLKARAWTSGGTAGAVYTWEYAIATIAVTNSPAAGSYNSPVSVTLSMNMPGSIYYTLDGSDPTTSSAVYTDPISLSCSTCPATITVKWLGADRAGNLSGIGSAGYTLDSPPPTTTVTFTSLPTEDGYMYEGGASLPNSSLGYLELGDLGLNKGERSVVSFDTSSIPDGATIVQATLTLYRYSNTYFNANGLGAIKADVKTGCFNSNCAVETADYSAASNQDGVVTIINIPIMDKQTAQGDLTTAGLAYIDKTGRTQLRVRFEFATNNNWSLDALRLYSGESTDASLRPALTVVYQ